MKIVKRISQCLSHERLLVLVLLVSFSIKGTILFSQGVINVDGVRYISAARYFSDGNFVEGLKIDWMPIYSLLIATFHFVIRDWALAGQLISFFALVLASIPLYLLTRDLFDEKVAFWAGLAFALSPILNGHAVRLLRDPPFLFFVSWSIFFYCRALHTRKIYFFMLASLSTIFALLFRLEAFLLLIVFLCVLIALVIKHRTERRVLLKGMAVAVGLPLVLGIMFGGGMLLAAGSEPTSFGPSGEPTWRLKETIAGNSLAYYKRKVTSGTLENYHNRYEQLKVMAKALPGGNRTGGVLVTARHYLPFIYLIGVGEVLARNLFPLFLFPLFVSFRNSPIFQRGHWFVLLSVGAYFLMDYYFLFTHDWIAKRYVLVPALLLFPWVGRGIVEIRSRITKCCCPRIAMVVFLVIFCGIPAFKSLGNFTGSRQINIHKVAGTWLSIQPGFQNAVVACSDPRIRFYSSKEMMFLKQMEKYSVAQDFSKMERVAIENKADLLVVETSKKKRQHIPEFTNFSLVKEIPGNINDVLIYQAITGLR